MKEPLTIKLTKCTLVLYEHEVWKLPPEILTAAIKRGKAKQRAEKQRLREQEKMERGR
jgi:hypothetical protein